MALVKEHKWLLKKDRCNTYWGYLCTNSLGIEVAKLVQYHLYLYLRIIHWKPLCAVFGWANECPVVAGCFRYSSMDHHASQPIYHSMSWNFEGGFLGEGINFMTVTVVKEGASMLHAWCRCLQSLEVVHVHSDAKLNVVCWTPIAEMTYPILPSSLLITYHSIKKIHDTGIYL